MTIQQVNQGAPIANSFATQAVNQRRVSAFDASQSSLVSMAPQEGIIGDAASTVWNVVTWPFRTVASIFSKVWNLIFGSSAPAAAAVDPLDDLKAAVKAKKYKADDFKAAYAALSEDDQKAYSTCVWIGMGHPVVPRGKELQDVLAKKLEKGTDQRLFRKAFEMMAAKGVMADMAQALGEEGLKDAKEVKKDFYNKLPGHVKEQVKHLAGILATGRAPALTDTLDTSKKMIPAIKRALEILVENNFVLVPDAAARMELQAMSAHGTAADENYVITRYAALSETTQKILADAVDERAGCKGNGDAYLRGVLVNRHGVRRNFDVNIVMEAVDAMVAFDQR